MPLNLRGSVLVCAACLLSYGPLAAAGQREAHHHRGEQLFAPPPHASHGPHVPERSFDTTSRVVVVAAVASTSNPGLLSVPSFYVPTGGSTG